jgi:hypothetical protein
MIGGLTQHVKNPLLVIIAILVLAPATLSLTRR